MTDYKETLNLPSTHFPMRANLPNREPLRLQKWQQTHLYQKIRTAMSQAPKFILHDGPPYANARPHMGTALNKILKDIIIKSKTLSGFDAPYVPGWDCHGLPIELNVEKKHGKAGEKLSKQEFRQACRQYAKTQVQLQRADFQRLGVLGDWENPYLTMDFDYEANTARALATMISNGYLVRGQKPVHWCTACASALAEAEVEYRDKTSPAIDVGFEVSPTATNRLFSLFNVSSQSHRALVPIWTTTPWTLPANQAVAVHPKLHYTLIKATIQAQPTYLVIAKDLITTVMARYGIDDYEVHGDVTGQMLENIELRHPFIDRVVPIICGEHVTTDTGTGNVHTAPAHGLDDFNVAKKYRLPCENPVNSRSCFVEGTPQFAGLHVFKANQPICDLLASTGHLLHIADLQHSYPHCWRHKTPLIFRATAQWFIGMDQNQLRDKALSAVEKTIWLPKSGAARMRRMVADRPDWCISRQRLWGIPIALFIHRDTAALHPDTPRLIEQVAERIAQHGVDAWFELDPQELLGDDAIHYEKLTDILDVWFESGVSHYTVLQQRDDLAVPADIYFEGSDQHRGWFQSSLLTGISVREAAAFKQIITHGYVVDGQGRKMSKSLGNTILPADIVKNFGADVLRLWVAASDYTNEIQVSDEILKRAADAYRRIRNTARFLLSNLYDFDPTQHIVPPEELVALDRWAVVTVRELQQKIINLYDNYNFSAIYQALHNFCTVTLGGFYLDIIKDRLYTSKKQGTPRRSAQTAVYYLIETLVRLLAPVTSFTADEIWEFMPGQRDESVFLSAWFDQFPDLVLTAMERQQWELLLRVRDEVNKALEHARNTQKIGSALAAKVILYADEVHFKPLADLGEELRFVLITSAATVTVIENKTAQATDTAIVGIAVEIVVSEESKCERCWQRQADVGENTRYPMLCKRCVENAFGEGESRYFA